MKRTTIGTNTHHAYDVYLKGKLLDTVFHTHPAGFATRTEREKDVKICLTDHDGYDNRIIVKERKSI